jgi:hypothetical protein
MSLKCYGQKILGECCNSTQVREAIYIDRNKKEVRITEKEKLDRLVTLINAAKRTPAKFIVVEELTIIKENGDSCVVKKNKEFLMVEGITFILNKRKYNELEKLLCSESDRGRKAKSETEWNLRSPAKFGFLLFRLPDEERFFKNPSEVSCNVINTSFFPFRAVFEL